MDPAFTVEGDPGGSLPSHVVRGDDLGINMS